LTYRKGEPVREMYARRMEDEEPPPLCPRCQQPMRLMHIVPRLGGQPELRSFLCRPCNEAVTKVVDEDT
jgi:hypothetical protein